MPDDTGPLPRLHEAIRRELAELIEVKNEELLQRHMALKPLMDLKGVAHTLGVSERTVETLVAGGRIRPLWIKGQRRFHPDTIDAYVRTCARRTRRPAGKARRKP